MTMREWIGELDDFLRLNARDLLNASGLLPTNAALAKAQSEFDKLRTVERCEASAPDVDFANTIEKANQIDTGRRSISRRRQRNYWRVPARWNGSRGLTRTHDFLDSILP
jgi:hypothetical protein